MVVKINRKINGIMLNGDTKTLVLVISMNPYILIDNINVTDTVIIDFVPILYSVVYSKIYVCILFP